MFQNGIKFLHLKCTVSILFLTPVFFMTPITNYMLFYSTLLCKKIARAIGGHNRFMLAKLRGGQIRSQKPMSPSFVISQNIFKVTVSLNFYPDYKKLTVVVVP